MKKVFLSVILFSGTACFAQNNIDLDPVTVTSSRTPLKASETGRSITVIDGKLFQQLPVNSVDELLKYVPGIEVQARGPMGAQSDIVMRGGTFQQVLVLLDGIKLNDPITGHFSSYFPVTPAEIERIEVLRGPAAAIYGAEAVGGVINIITKTFNKFKKEKANKENITLAVGEYNFINGNAGWYTTGPKVNAAVGVLSNNTNGQLLRGSNRGFIQNNTFSGSVSFALNNNWQLAVRSSYDSRDFAAQNFYTTFASDTATETVKTFWNQLQLKQQKGRSSRQIDLMYKHTKDHYLYNKGSIANDNKSDNLVFQYLQTSKLSDQFTANFGTQIDQRKITSNDRGNHSTAHGAIFGSMLYTKNKLRILPGIRADWDENYGVAVLPQLNLSYLLKNVTVRANVGRAIRSADFTERFNNYNKPLVKSGSIGNPNLTTENSWSYEIGADAFLCHNFKVSVSGFYRDQNDVIDYVSTPYADMPRQVNLSPGATYALAKNIKKVKTSGLELDATYQQALGHQQSLLVNAGATFLHSTSSDSVPSFYILSHAKTIIQGNIIYSYKKFSIATNMIFKERKPSKATAINANLSKNYFLLNTRISFAPNSMVKFFISCNNITNIQYSDLLGSIMPRRWTSGGVTIDL